MIYTITDEQTTSHINEKKAIVIPFENVPIRPELPMLVISCRGAGRGANIFKKAPKQKILVVSLSSFFRKGRCVKVCPVAEWTTKQIHVHVETILKDFKTVNRPYYVDVRSYLHFAICVISFSIKLKMNFLIAANN